MQFGNVFNTEIMVVNYVMWVFDVVYDYNGDMHLLSVSRCILKIIPTIVIYNTPELESWIENKY